MTLKLSFTFEILLSSSIDRTVIDEGLDDRGNRPKQLYFPWYEPEERSEAFGPVLGETHDLCRRDADDQRQLYFPWYHEG